MANRSMGAAAIPPDDAEVAFRQALGQVVRSVDGLYRLAERLCCVNPVLSAHVRELAESFAGEALSWIARWPS